MQSLIVWTLQGCTLGLGRGLEAERLEKLLPMGLFNRMELKLFTMITYYAKQPYWFCFFFYFNSFWQKNDVTVLKANSLLWHKKYITLKELIKIKWNAQKNIEKSLICLKDIKFVSLNFLWFCYYFQNIYKIRIFISSRRIEMVHVASSFKFYPNFSVTNKYF